MQSMKPNKLNHIRFSFAQIKSFRLALTDEQMCRLFFAVADYAMYGVRFRVPVDDDIAYPYKEYCARIDNAIMALEARA